MIVMKQACRKWIGNNPLIIDLFTQTFCGSSSFSVNICWFSSMMINWISLDFGQKTVETLSDILYLKWFIWELIGRLINNLAQSRCSDRDREEIWPCRRWHTGSHVGRPDVEPGPGEPPQPAQTQEVDPQVRKKASDAPETLSPVTCQWWKRAGWTEQTEPQQ